MLIAPTRKEFKAAQSLQTHCDLDHITLLRCSTSRVPAGTQLSEPYTLSASNSSAAKLTDDVLTVEASFNSIAVDANKAQVFAVECVYELCYRLKESYKPQENEIEAFKNGNAIFNCWPYFREFFQDITARMGQAPPTLPLLRVVPRPATPIKPEANLVKTEAEMAPAEADPPSVAHRRPRNP
ncbi:MAG: hypothetical protein AAB225_16530 [Acidobacteriota bacterium]